MKNISIVNAKIDKVEMQSLRKPVDKKNKLDISKEDSTAKKQDEKNKKSDHRLSTPRNFVSKSTADIYAKSSSNVNAPKKANSKVTNVSPMKDLLKSSPSSVTQNSSRSYRLNREDARKLTPNSARDHKKKVPIKTMTNKKLTNVIVNSPIVKRKLDLGHDKLKEVASKEVALNSNLSKKVLLPERQRTKTRTLDDEEIKVLTPDVVDNNAELLNLTRKLSAKPKAFYVDLNEETNKPTKEKSSDEEVSYEDDFESYESDFDSYHSEENSSTDGSDHETNDDASDEQQYDNESDGNVQLEDEDVNSKEERMLDSGNYELRDPRSANKSKPMDFISEVSEDGEAKIIKQNSEDSVKVSLTDEGFQDMSSIKTIHVDVLDRPLFIDFTKSKENKRKRRIFEKLQRRAKDILSMVTLHEMSYNLFEMAPIPYDLYMATFGRFNYTQTAVQTFDDGITEEIQTEKIEYQIKWTQCPVEFSDTYIHLNDNKNDKLKNEDYEFKFLNENDNESDVDDTYKSDPLRIYLEQKDGAGPDAMMPIEKYKTKLKNNSYNLNRLRKFLKKFECRVSNILSINTGNTDMSNLIKTSKFPFSAGYLSISKVDFDKTFLSKSQIIATVMSETKNNLIITIHSKFTSGFVVRKCVMCLWDLSVAIREPLKILISTDNVKIGRFRGSTDGIFVGALEDGSIQLWDLSDEATWSSDVTLDDKSINTVEIDSKHLTHTERDREWNLRNSTCVSDENQLLLQASSYTSSAMAVCKNESVDSIVGLEFMGDMNTANLGAGRKIIRQICSLQRTGMLTIWSIVQEKTNSTNDMGKTFWSKLKLERNQTINLTDNVNAPVSDEFASFNLNAAKKRLTVKRQERNLTKISRAKSAINKFDVDRPNSAASVKNKHLVGDNSFYFWENGLVFYHLKVMQLKNVDSYLVAKNSGEVLCCRRTLGTVKVKTLCVANAASSIIHLESSPHGLPYFLAGTDTGTVNLCSLIDFRVLLTLECGNGPAVVDKCIADNKGRYLSSVQKTLVDNSLNVKLAIKSICWSHTNPFCIIAICNTDVHVWELTHSDMRAKCTSGDVAHCCSTERALALLTTEGNVQIYKMSDETKNLDLFKRYVSLL